MAFTFVRNMISGIGPIAPPKDNVSYEINETTMAAGQVAKFHTDGTLKNATDDNDDAAVIVMESGASGATVRCQWILPGAVYKTVINEGTAASVVIGNNYEISATFNGLNQGAPGPLTVIKKDGSTVWVLFNSCLLSSATKRT